MKTNHMRELNQKSGILLLCLVAQLSISELATAQLPSHEHTQRYWPISQHSGVGNYARMLQSVQPTPNQFQYVRVQLPRSAKVTVYHLPKPEVRQHGQFPGKTTRPLPAVFGLQVGQVYRLRIHSIRDLPGVDLYPTVEVLGKLNPPPGREANYPVPVELSEQEIQHAINGRLVTKVIYLEEPKNASHLEQGEFIPTARYPDNVNLLQEAGHRGRPMLILRVGGRVPNLLQPDPSFFGRLSPVAVPSQPVPAQPAPNQPVSEPSVGAVPDNNVLPTP